LREWRKNFHARLPEVRALGYDDRFVRMWDCYLSFCEGGFAEQHTGLLQLLYARPGFRVDPPA
jgi:cyclopropane-fatty-acyl-phospholipid synthase